MRASRLPRLLRGTGAALVATFVALLSHVSAGGEMPGPLGVAVPLILSIFVCVALAGARLSLARVSLAVVVSQVLFHVLFVVGAPSVAGSVAVSGHAHHAAVFLPEAIAGSGTDAAMWLGHALAAVLTIVAIRRADRALACARRAAADVAAWVRRRLRVDLPVRRVEAVSRRIVSAVFARPASGVFDPVRRRGPPLPV